MLLASHPWANIGGRRALLLATGLLVGVSGCGLSAYEAKMLTEQERLKRFDADALLLGDPIELPDIQKGKTVIKPPVDIFLRPPLGIRKEYDPPMVNQFFYRYPVKLPEIIGGARPKEGPKPLAHDVMVAVAMHGNFNNFRDEGIKRAFPKVQPAAGRTVVRPGRNPLTFQAWSFVDESKPPMTLLVFACQEEKNLVAICYKVESAKMQEAAKAIDASLGTLVIGPAATALRQGYKPYVAPKPAPKPPPSS